MPRLKLPLLANSTNRVHETAISDARSHYSDTSNISDCKIGAIPNLAHSANVAPVPVSSTSPSTGGGYRPAPTSHIAHTSPNSQQSRKRNASTAELDSSPGSQESPEHDGTGADNDGKRHPVKRACNECRQQKVSHMAGKWKKFNTYILCSATMRCQTRPHISPLQPVQPSAAIMQDRRYIQACRETVTKCGNGAGNPRPQAASGGSKTEQAVVCAYHVVRSDTMGWYRSCSCRAHGP